MAIGDDKGAGILQISFLNNIFKLLRKGKKQLTLGRIILKDPTSRLAPADSRGEHILRPTLVVWVTRVGDMDKGTMCEFGNASAHDLVEVK